MLRLPIQTPRISLINYKYHLSTQKHIKLRPTPIHSSPPLQQDSRRSSNHGWNHPHVCKGTHSNSSTCRRGFIALEISFTKQSHWSIQARLIKFVVHAGKSWYTAPLSTRLSRCKLIKAIVAYSLASKGLFCTLRNLTATSRFCATTWTS